MSKWFIHVSIYTMDGTRTTKSFNSDLNNGLELKDVIGKLLEMVERVKEWIDSRKE